MAKIVSIKNTMISRNTPSVKRITSSRQQNLTFTSPAVLRPVSQFATNKNLRNKTIVKELMSERNTKTSFYHTHVTNSSRVERTCEKFPKGIRNISPVDMMITG